MMHSKKAISHCWQQSQNHLQQTNNKSKVVGKHEVNLSLPQKTSTQTPKDYERLRRRMWEMKHRVCLLEFGLGSVAKLVQGCAFDGPVENTLKEKVGIKVTLDDAKRNKEVIKGIGAILKDIEACMKSGFATEPCHSGELVKTGQLNEVATTCKSRIFIDEMKTGGNSLTAVVATTTNGLCKTQVMENAVMFPSSNQEKHEKCINSNLIGLNIHSNDHNQCSFAGVGVGTTSDPSFDPIKPLDALSTLAFVASSYKHVNELNGIGKIKLSPITQEGLKHEAIGNKGHEAMTQRNQVVNPFIYSEETDSDKVPLKKRQRRAGVGASSKDCLEAGVVYEGIMTKKRRTLRQ